MRKLLFLAGTSFFAMQPVVGHAVEAAAVASPSGVLDEIVVTARRSSESAQSVPMSITAFSQDMLRQQNISSAQELNKAVPGLTVAAVSGNPSIPAFAIRGRGLNYGAAAGSVETYFADVPLSMPFQAFALPPQFFDLGSFQVLKGPQGTLFGRSTTGGAVVIVPHGVDGDFGGYARLQGGDYGNVQAEGAVNLPLVKDLAGLRLAGFYWKRDGYSRVFPGNVDRMHNTSLDGQRYNNRDVYELRGTLKLTPTAQLENSTIVTYHSDENRGSAGAGIARSGATGSIPVHGYGTQWSDSDVRFDDQARSDALGVINTTTYEATEQLTLKNIFGYIHSEGYTAAPSNPDGTARSTVDLPSTPRLNKTTQYTNEFQVQGEHFDGRFKWIAGVLFDWTRQPTGLDELNIQSINYSSTPCGAGCVLVKTTYGSNKVDSRGAFVSGNYEIVPNLTVSGGFRRSWDKVTLYTGDVFDPLIPSPSNNPPLTPLPTSALRVLSKKFTGNTYNADISYKIGRAMVYGGYRHGYKRGGFQPSAPTADGAGFGPEKVDNLYAGVKSEFDVYGRRMRANFEVYHDAYKGQQVSYLTVGPGNSIVSNELNIDKSTFVGLDAELSAEVTDWWVVSANYAFTDAKVKDWIDRSVPGSTVDLTNNPAPYVSKNKLTAISRFHVDTEVGEAVLQGSVNYESKSYAGPTCRTYPLATQAIFRGNFDAIAAGGCVVPKHTTFDLRAELNNVAKTQLSLAVNITNLGDKTYWTGTSNTLLFGVEGYSYAPPRMFSVEATYKF